MRLIILILVLAVSSCAQTHVAISKDQSTDFFVYTESATREGNRILFSGKYKTKDREDISLFLTNCTNRTYVVIMSQIKVGKKVTYHSYKEFPVRTAIHGSAMEAALDHLCFTVNKTL